MKILLTSKIPIQYASKSMNEKLNMPLSSVTLSFSERRIKFSGDGRSRFGIGKLTLTRAQFFGTSPRKSLGASIPGAMVIDSGISTGNSPHATMPFLSVLAYSPVYPVIVRTTDTGLHGFRTRHSSCSLSQRRRDCAVSTILFQLIDN